MSTDFRALCARMVDELDLYRQLLMDDRREIHALAAEARALLAQPEPQGPTGRPAIEPVPVSERLPGPEDCDAEGLCWWWEPDCEQPEAWCIGLPEYCSSSTHWLPHWALPVPVVEGEQ
jgi:hypothetical protein